MPLPELAAVGPAYDACFHPDKMAAESHHYEVVASRCHQTVATNGPPKKLTRYKPLVRYNLVTY